MAKAIRTTINANGRIVVPAAMRAELGVKPGDEVMLRMEAGELRVYTLGHALQAFRRDLARFVPPGRSLVDELIQDRRAEAARGNAQSAARGSKHGAKS